MDSGAETRTADHTVEDRLRPLASGEIFDRTFSIFRSHLVLFCGIAMVPALVSLVYGAVRLVILSMAHLPLTTSSFSHIGLALFAIAGILISFAIYGVSGAASTSAIAAIYLGRTSSVEAAYRSGMKHTLRYALLILAKILSAGWITVIAYAVMLILLGAMSSTGNRTTSSIAVGLCAIVAFLSLPFSIYQYIRVSLAIPASVVEGLPIGASLERSKALMLDRKWRVFLLFLMLGVFYLILGSVIAYMMYSVMHGKSHLLTVQIVTLALSFVAALFLQPVDAICLCLIYFDERVRREAFDIEFMLQRLSKPSSDALEGSVSEGTGA